MERFRFKMAGQVVEVRELLTKDNKVWAHSARVEVPGNTLEAVTKDLSMAAKLREAKDKGQEVVCEGGCETYKGSIKLLVDSVKPVVPARAAA